MAVEGGPEWPAECPCIPVVCSQNPVSRGGLPTPLPPGPMRSSRWPQLPFALHPRCHEHQQGPVAGWPGPHLARVPPPFQNQHSSVAVSPVPPRAHRLSMMGGQTPLLTGCSKCRAGTWPGLMSRSQEVGSPPVVTTAPDTMCSPQTLGQVSVCVPVATRPAFCQLRVAGSRTP